MKLTWALGLILLCATRVLAAADMPGIGHAAPVIDLLASRPALRLEVMSQIQGLNSGGIANTQTAVDPQAAAVVRGLLQQPQVIQDNAAAFAGLLGADSLQGLIAVSGQPALVSEFLKTGHAVDPTDVASVGRLAAMFDGRSGAVVSADHTGVRSDANHAGVNPAIALKKPLSKKDADRLKMLEDSLKIMELPPYKEAVDERSDFGDQPAVVIAGLPSIWKLAMYREGGRQSPGNVVLAMNADWFISKTLPNGDVEHYITKGLHFEKDGKQAVLVTYKHPRKVGYFANLLTMGAFDTDEGVPLEKNFAGPMSSSSELEKDTNDKLLTRILLAEEGVGVPYSRAFLLPDHPFLKMANLPSHERARAMALPDRAHIRAAVKEYLSHYKGPEVVVKPSGPRFHSGAGVKYFKRNDIDGIVQHIYHLGHEHPLMDNAGLVLLEQRLAPAPVFFRLMQYLGFGDFAFQDKKVKSLQILSKEEALKAANHERKDSNERIYVVQGLDGEPEMVEQSFFRAGTWGVPTSGQPENPQDAAAVVSFEVMRKAMMEQHGLLMTDAEVERFHARRRDLSIKAMRAIAKYEKTRKLKPGEPKHARTDLIGLDIMYEVENGELIPYVIEVNDHDAAGQHVLDLFYPDNVGEHTRKLTEVMLGRAKRGY